jgi:hypothetical protein
MLIRVADEQQTGTVLQLRLDDLEHGWIRILSLVKND